MNLTWPEFRALARQYNCIPLAIELSADTETPLSAYLKIAGPYGFLFESVEGGEQLARYSFLGTAPSKVLRFSRNQNPFQTIEEIVRGFRVAPPDKSGRLPRFRGGLVGYLGYDTVRWIEKIPLQAKDDLGVPEAMLLFMDTLIAFDHVTHKMILIANAIVRGSPRGAYDEARRKLSQLVQKLQRPLRMSTLTVEEGKGGRGKLWKSNMAPREFQQMVQRARRYILDGDVIQVVLSQRFSGHQQASPLSLYRILRTLNPSPYMFYLSLGNIALVGSSPEVMVRLNSGEAILRPIAGTRPRGETLARDRMLEQQLLRSKKERAEHIMLVDLGRNDLGRVCLPASVKVTELMQVERYSHVMHLVSNVQGKVRPGITPSHVLQAAFPAGTVSGAPKVRAMEIIDELEPVRRGPYAGAVGYFGFDGALDTAITIRTILCQGSGFSVQAGAGIVADSNPEREYEETLNKARGLLKAVELAQNA